MVEHIEVAWPTCRVAGCIGIRLASARTCLAHADEEAASSALASIGKTGTIDARGVPITPPLLERILAATPRGEHDRHLIKECRFERATFNGHVQFTWTTFMGEANFTDATFNGEARFNVTTFKSRTSFERTTFNGLARLDSARFNDVDFEEAIFQSDAIFDSATFSSTTDFGKATFNGKAWLGAAFNREASFRETAFNSAAIFEWARFGGETRFDDATFVGEAGFWETTFRQRAVFYRARFEQTRDFGPVLAYRGLELDEVQFAQQVRIEVSAAGLCCRRARFSAGVQFRLRWARVLLDDSDFAAPSILAGVPTFFREGLAEREARFVKAWQRLFAGRISEQPQLMSLRRANVAGLGLSNLSAVDCRFAGAHNLDKLRLESDVSFGFAPSPRRPLRGKLAGREVIAEERAWRAVRSPSQWVAPTWPDWLEEQQPDVLFPGQIAGLYRGLRKGREDSKDEPGAADFYYGEMEMRRARPAGSRFGIGCPNSTSRGRVERGILTAYWLVSGYGLRAWRAVAWLIAVTALLAMAFHTVGFAVPPQSASYWTSLLYAFRATLSLSDDQVKLTAWGQLLQGVLRLTGPVLLGLALLALRGRVKR